MTLQQLRCLCEAVTQGLNLSRTARALHTSQPAVTKMIRALESELGVEILVRAGPKIVAISDQGQEVLAQAKRVLHDIKNLRLAANDSKDSSTGVLRIATSHLQARYALVNIIRRFASEYPEVDLNLHQGTPEEIAAWTASGEVDIGVATMPDRAPLDLLKLDAYPITRCVIAPPGHPLLKKRKPSLADLGKYKLITYDGRFKTGNLVERAFSVANLDPRITMKATDADVVKTYVALGLGIAVIQEMAIDTRDDSIRAINVDHLFPVSTTWIMLRKGQYLRKFLYDFIAMISPKWTRSEIDKALRVSYRGPMAGNK